MLVFEAHQTGGWCSPGSSLGSNLKYGVLGESGGNLCDWSTLMDGSVAPPMAAISSNPRQSDQIDGIIRLNTPREVLDSRFEKLV